MSDDEDDRYACKYGADCYQKNPLHHLKYKHPKKRPSEDDGEHETEVKKVKPSENDIDPEEEVEEKGEESDEESRSLEKETLIRDAEKDNYLKDIILVSNLPKDVKEKIKSIFGVEMPKDFYDFFDFCKSLGGKSVKKSLVPVGWELVGPYDVMEGELKDCLKEDALRHYRYYYDPPEFQTVLKGNDKTGEHYGYFRDDPKELPCFVAKNESLLNCTIDVVAGNLFATLNIHIDKIKKTADPFKKMQIHKILTALQKFVKTHKISLDRISPEMRKRRSHILAKTFHGAGLVVPYNPKTEVGYRKLSETDADLKKLLGNLCQTKSDAEKTAYWSQLQPVITNANIANDESDFGTSLELGLDLFSFGSYHLHKTVLQQLTTAYSLLNRELYSDIIKAHLQNRIKGTKFLNTISKN